MLSTSGALPAGSLAASAEHVTYSFDVLVHYFSGKKEDAVKPQFEDLSCPLFVTWKRTSRHGEARLRGCIGILEPRSLHASLRDYVLASSLRDRRFEPVAERELPLLQCTVSLLHSFEPASDWRDWEIGVHGLIITFACPRTQDMLTATFLPEVAHQEEWSHEETIEHLMRKAGAAPGTTPAARRGLDIVRYQSSARTMTYQEYCTLKQGGAAVGACAKEKP